MTKTQKSWEIARKCLQESGEDVVSAVNEFEKEVRADQSLFFDVMDPMCHQACYDVIRKLICKNRQHIWNSSSGPVQGSEQMKDQASFIKAELYNLPLHNGKILAHATRVDLSECIEVYERQTKNMMWKQRFFTIVLSKLTTGTVKDNLTEEDLRKIQKQAE